MIVAGAGPQQNLSARMPGKDRGKAPGCASLQLVIRGSKLGILLSDAGNACFNRTAMAAAGLGISRHILAGRHVLLVIGWGMVGPKQALKPAASEELESVVAAGAPQV